MALDATNPLLQMALAGLQARAGSVPPGGAPAAAAAPGANPMQALLAGNAGPAVGAPGGNGGGGGAPDMGNDVSAMLANLRGADPGMLVRQINNIKRLLAVLSVHFMEPLPQVAGEISKVIPQLNRITGQAEKAQNVNAAVRGAQQSRQPIAMGAAQPTPVAPPAMGAQPGPMGMAA